LFSDELFVRSYLPERQSREITFDDDGRTVTAGAALPDETGNEIARRGFLGARIWR